MTITRPNGQCGGVRRRRRARRLVQVGSSGRRRARGLSPEDFAACHATAPDAAATDWPQIAALYGELGRMMPTAVVELNRAVAVAMADGPEAGLALVDALDASGDLRDYHLLP